jgi:F-type H+-transporting ATPase subunit delta
LRSGKRHRHREIVTQRTAAARYARALFDVALKERADLARVESELAGFLALVQRHDGLAKALFNPAVPAPKKRAAVDQLTAQANVLPIVRKLLVLLAERDRLVLLQDLAGSYRQRLMNHQNVVQAEVTTAMPLETAHARHIEEGLARATGRTVRLSTKVDPALMGGIVARVGSTVYDGSVANQLQRMKNRLAESL